MTFDELSDAVKFRCEQRLGHLGGRVVMNRLDYDTSLAVGWILPDGRRHAVARDELGIGQEYPDPAELADEMADKLLEWLAGRGT